MLSIAGFYFTLLCSIVGCSVSDELNLCLVSYASGNIQSYALYSSILLEHYADHNLYGTNILSWLDPEVYDLRDHRWNKVKIILEAMRNNSVLPNAENFSHYVWFDADMIVLDFNWKIQNLIDQYRNYDIIISSDVDYRNGMVNTGCMIVRASEWSKQFLTQWWGSALDHTTGSDQLAFTALYTSIVDGKDHIAVLPHHLLNSRIPAWKYQEPQDTILHLAGETNAYRSKVFQYALAECFNQSVCSVGGRMVANLSPQWGLTREVLSQLRYEHITVERIATASSILASTQYDLLQLKAVTSLDDITDPNLSVTKILQSIDNRRSAIRDLLQINRNVLSHDAADMLSEMGTVDLILLACLDNVYLMLRLVEEKLVTSEILSAGVASACRGITMLKQSILDTAFEYVTLLSSSTALCTECSLVLRKRIEGHEEHSNQHGKLSVCSTMLWYRFY